ncbi:hypothetical protein RDI58_024628 [Solanum bulbocastanum]|uniref:U1-type domain-containing protein n=1 Tax=Solanum bulbocastanum TaxID=147425 RepID=A0AAN8Y352_SOLBU
MERKEVMCGEERLKNQVEVFEEMISEAKPETVSSGAKQKAIILIEEVADKPSLSSTSALVKNVTKWNCELCQVYPTSQDGLNDHLQGKKHKLKVVDLREHKDNIYCSIGLLQKKPKLMQPMEHP